MLYVLKLLNLSMLAHWRNHAVSNCASKTTRYIEVYRPIQTILDNFSTTKLLHTNNFIVSGINTTNNSILQSVQLLFHSHFTCRPIGVLRIRILNKNVLADFFYPALFTKYIRVYIIIYRRSRLCAAYFTIAEDAPYHTAIIRPSQSYRGSSILRIA